MGIDWAFRVRISGQSLPSHKGGPVLRTLDISTSLRLKNAEKEKSWSSPMEREERGGGASAHAIVILRAREEEVSFVIHWVQRGKLLLSGELHCT